MSTELKAADPGEADFATIEAAVMETARGRWFLAEYARRNRSADTKIVLSAIKRLEDSVRPAPAPTSAAVDADAIARALSEMSHAIKRTRDELRDDVGDDDEGRDNLEDATHELDAIVRQTEKATSDILASAERVQEIAWTMREQGAEDDLCERLDSHATEIYTACSFQDLTGQRIRHVIQTLRYIEGRLNTLIDMWGRPIPAEPVDLPTLDRVSAETLEPESVATQSEAGAAEPAVVDKGEGVTVPGPEAAPIADETPVADDLSEDDTAPVAVADTEPVEPVPAEPAGQSAEGDPPEPPDATVHAAPMPAQADAAPDVALKNTEPFNPMSSAAGAAIAGEPEVGSYESAPSPRPVKDTVVVEPADAGRVSLQTLERWSAGRKAAYFT